MIIYKITDWNKHFENNRTRGLKKLDWIPIPNKQDGDGYTDLICRKNGPALFGAWHAILQVASKCDPRGTLVRDRKIPHNAESISRITRFPAAIIADTLKACSEIGWITCNSLEDNIDIDIPHEGAVLEPHDSAVLEPHEGDIEGKGMEGKGMEGNTSKAIDLIEWGKYVEKELRVLNDDHVWISVMEKAFPEINISLALRNMWSYWQSENGYKKKRGNLNSDWKRTALAFFGSTMCQNNRSLRK